MYIVAKNYFSVFSLSFVVPKQFCIANYLVWKENLGVKKLYSCVYN